jgi:hypothetical protein
MKMIIKLSIPALCLGLGITVLSSCEKNNDLAPLNTRELSVKPSPPPILNGQGGSSGKELYDYTKLNLNPKPKIGIPQIGTLPTLYGQGGTSGAAFFDYKRLDLNPKLKFEPEPEPWQIILKP